MSKKILCPTCEKEVVMETTNLFRPFCSKRCRLVDLGLWFDETFSIAETSTTNEKYDTEPARKH